MLNQLINVLMKLVEQLINILPKSPFKGFIDQLNGSIPYIGFINWIVPVKQILIVGGVWLSAIAIYYIYSAILRWIKAID